MMTSRMTGRKTPTLRDESNWQWIWWQHRWWRRWWTWWWSWWCYERASLSPLDKPPLGLSISSSSTTMFSNTLMMSNVIIFLLLSFMLILASGEYEWRRRKQWDYWIFCELGQRRWYDEIIWLANPGSWPGGEYNQQKLYKVIRGKKTKWTKNKEMNPMCHNKKTKKVFWGEAVWALNLILQNTAFSSHWSRAGLL